ncbi:hypothetical protein ACX1C1_12020 [Paenibacillus sp. strain BS8-2]
MSFDVHFDKFLIEQIKTASGRRLEMLKKDLVAEKKMFQEVLWPVFRTFQGFVMQYELVTFTGVTIFIDVFYAPMGIAFESEGFVAHAENITRDRFDFEKHRVRTLANKGYLYYPFTWDELNKKPDKCRTSLLELLGTMGASGGEQLTLYEQAVIKYATYINRPFDLRDVRVCLKRGDDVCRKVLKELQSKHYIMPLNAGRQRVHAYVLADDHSRKWSQLHMRNH